MSAFVKLDTADGDYFVHRCPACGKPPLFADFGSDGKVIHCGTKGHEYKFNVDEYTIEEAVKEWNARCARYIAKLNMIKKAQSFTRGAISPQ